MIMKNRIAFINLLFFGFVLVGADSASQSSNPTESTVGSVTIEPANRPTSAPNDQIVSHKSPLNGRQFGDQINDIKIECNSNNIVVTLITNHGFNGMIYPKGLSKNSTCMTEYHEIGSNITYYLPLRSCNTMSSEVEDGIEYFNTVMVQPHRRLVTNQGRGYHIRCRYQTKERTITNYDQRLSVNLTHSTPAVVGSATMPTCTMKIYSANDLSHEVAAENVRIGDELHLVISLDDQDVYGMLITNCLVRDGLNWGEQPLIDENGCPVDEEIMPQFNYAHNLTKASVTFQAHKFPYTPSVYYQCNIRLCFKESGCAHVPPQCDGLQSTSKRNFRALIDEGQNDIHGRQKRWVDGGELDGRANPDELTNRQAGNMNLEVFSGLSVADSEIEVNAKSNQDEPMMMAATSEDATREEEEANGENEGGKSVSDKRRSERDFCMSLRKFAIAISLASLLLLAAILIMIACMIQRRKRQKEQARQSFYEHHQAPYLNSGYCRD